MTVLHSHGCMEHNQAYVHPLGDPFRLSLTAFCGLDLILQLHGRPSPSPSDQKSQIELLRGRDKGHVCWSSLLKEVQDSPCVEK